MPGHGRYPTLRGPKLPDGTNHIRPKWSEVGDLETTLDRAGWLGWLAGWLGWLAGLAGLAGWLGWLTGQASL